MSVMNGFKTDLTKKILGLKFNIVGAVTQLGIMVAIVQNGMIKK